MSIYISICYLDNATCRRYAIDGEEPRDEDEPLSAAANTKSSFEPDRVGKRREDVRTKYCDVDIRFGLKRVGLSSNILFFDFILI